MTDTTLPASVRKQAESADALYRSVYSTPDDQSGHAESQAEESQQESAKQAQQGEDRDALYWQQRFNVLQGKYNSEVPALQQQVRDLQAQLSESAQSGKAAEFADQLESDLTEDELEYLGPELINTIRKLIAKSVPGDIDELKSKVDGYERESQEHKQALFWTEVNSAIPDWQTMQSKPEAQQWLAGIDETSGQVRNDLLTRAAQQLNAPQVIAIFRAMAGVIGRQIPGEKIQPGTSRAAPRNGDSGKLWSRSEINAFYRDKTQGRYSDEQAAAIEADIFAAQNEGRVTA